MGARLQTLSVPAIGQASVPAILVRAARDPVRCVVRNIGDTDVLLSLVAQSLLNTTSLMDTYRLPAGVRDVFFLSVGDSLYGAGLVAGLVSTHVMPMAPAVDAMS